jgi:hypothetical protein
MNAHAATSHHDPLQPDPELTAIERRLERRGPASPPPTLRHRVLMAVDDVLTLPQPLDRDGDDVMIPGWAWAAAAVLGIAMTAPVVAGLQAVRCSEPRSLVAQLRANGVDDEPLLAAFTAPPRDDDAVAGKPSAAEVALPRPTSHVMQLQRLLEEML